MKNGKRMKYQRKMNDTEHMLSYKFVCPFVIPLAHRMETEGLHLFIHECPYRDIMMDVRIKITLLRLKKTKKSVYVICSYQNCIQTAIL